MDWSQLGVVLLSFAWGTGSAVVPLLNAEAYVIAAQVTPGATTARGIAVAIAVATGQAVGKLILFQTSRHGRQLAVLHRRRRRHQPRRTAPHPAGASRWWRYRHQAADTTHTALSALLQLVSSPRWGIPIVALAAVVGIPPIYAVALLAGASRMRLPLFAVTVWVGRIIRFVLLAEGARQGLTHLPH